MLNILSPDLIKDQLNTLGDIHRNDYKKIERSIKACFSSLELASVHRVYAFGDGDSYHAALAAEMAFNEFAKIRYTPHSAMRFLEYSAEYLPINFPRDTIVLGISASGNTTRVAQGLERVKNLSNQCLVTAVAGNVKSPVAKAANKILDVQLPDLGRIPGVRTYTASLMGLIGLAIRIGVIKRHYHMEEGNNLRKEIVEMADLVEKTYEASIKPAKKAVEIIKDFPFVSYVGSGPSFGTAWFSSAKIVEACGLFSIAQDLEEWMHVERFAYPLDYPVVIIAPPGKSYWRAAKFVQGAKTVGHPVISVISEDDKEISSMSDVIFPVKGNVREAFSPLLYYVPGTYLAYELAKTIGRNMFLSDNEKATQTHTEMTGQIYG